MSIAYAEDNKVYPSYEARLRAESKARRARIAARAVHDDGIDLKRKPPAKWIVPVTAPPLQPAEPVDECGAWEAAERRVYFTGYRLPLCVALDAPTIMRTVGRYFNVSRVDLCSERRTRNIVRPRQIGMYLVKMLTRSSLPSIGRMFGGRDHTTALCAIRRIASMRTTDTAIESTIVAIAAILSQAGMDVEPLGVVNG